MTAGGMLTLATERAPGQILLRVADTGIGMTKEMAARVFDAFFTTRHYGSGLGLAVVWDIVQAHGATVGVESAPGEGAVFTIRLPVAPRGQEADPGVLGDLEVRAGRLAPESTRMERQGEMT
jgi:signal transduction histidine kinase